MYYPYFITYMLAGFAISILVFVWALKNGQFRDQQRARFLPLERGVAPEPLRVSRINRLEGYALLGLACLGLLATAAVLIFALVRGG
jgi:cbb3-type cytochrome oxidase maturation protein